MINKDCVKIIFNNNYFKKERVMLRTTSPGPIPAAPLYSAPRTPVGNITLNDGRKYGVSLTFYDTEGRVMYLTPGPSPLSRELAGRIKNLVKETIDQGPEAETHIPTSIHKDNAERPYLFCSNLSGEEDLAYFDLEEVRYTDHHTGADEFNEIEQEIIDNQGSYSFRNDDYFMLEADVEEEDDEQPPTSPASSRSSSNDSIGDIGRGSGTFQQRRPPARSPRERVVRNRYSNDRTTPPIREALNMHSPPPSRQSTRTSAGANNPRPQLVQSLSRNGNTSRLKRKLLDKKGELSNYSSLSPEEQRLLRIEVQEYMQARGDKPQNLTKQRIEDEIRSLALVEDN